MHTHLNSKFAFIELLLIIKLVIQIISNCEF